MTNGAEIDRSVDPYALARRQREVYPPMTMDGAGDEHEMARPTHAGGLTW